MRRQAPPADDTLALVFRGEIDALYRTALRLLGSPEEAEDAVQDAYLRIAHPAQPQEMPRHPRGWIFRVLRNLCIDKLRARKSRLRLVSETDRIETLAQYSTDHRTPESDLLTSDTLDRVARAMDAMPPDLSETLALVVIEGLSYREAASVLGIPVGTVRSRLNRARQSLRTLIETADSSHLSTVPKVQL